MKKLFTLFAAALLAGSMMATDPVVLTFSDWGDTSLNKDGKPNNTAGDYGTEYKAAVLIDSLNGAAGFVTCTATSKVYAGRVNMGSKLGSSSAVGSFTLSLVTPAEYDSIVVSCASYSTSEGSLSINGGTAIDLTDGGTSNKKLRNVVYVPTGEVTTLTIATTVKRAYVKTITFYPKTVAVLPAGPTISIDNEEQTFSILTANESDIFFFNGGPVATLSEETALEGFADQISFVDADYTLAELVDDGSAYEGSLEDIPFELFFEEPGEYALAAMCVVENDPVAHTVVAASEMSYTTFTVVAAASGCDWENIAFIGDGAQGGALSNKYKFCTEAENVAIVNIQHPGFATADGLYISLPDAAFGEIRIKGAKAAYDVQGAGILVHLTNFTDVETEVEIMNMDNTDVRWTFNIYYADGANTPTDIENLEGVMAVKYLENGMVVIIREGVRYNAAGQVVK